MLEPGGDKLPPAPYVAEPVAESISNATSEPEEEMIPSTLSRLAEAAEPADHAPRPAVISPKKSVGKFSLSSLKEQLSNGTLGEKPTEVKEDAADSYTGTQRPINPQELQQAWNKAAQLRQADGRMAEYFILNRPFEFKNGTEIHLKVDNNVQIEQFNSVKAELLGELRHKLQNNKLNVIVEFEEVTEGKRLYTSIDKYNYLVEQYPALEELKKRLGLDTDF